MGLWHRFEDEVIERFRLHSLTFLRDVLVVCACYTLAEYLRFVPKSVPHSDVVAFAETVPIVGVIYLISLYLFGVHRRLWQYAGVRDMRALVDAVVVATLATAILDAALYSLDRLYSSGRPMPWAVVFSGGVLSLGALSLVRLWPRLFRARARSEEGWSRVLVVGAGHGGNLVVADLLANPQWKQLPVGFIDDDPSKMKRRIHNVPVLGGIDDLCEIVEEHRIDTIGVAIPSASTKEVDRILALAQQTECRIQVVPTIGDIINRVAPFRLRNINLDDLLNRVPRTQDEKAETVDHSIAGRTVLVTGGAGSIGSELCRQVMFFHPKELIALDNNETGLFYLERDLLAMGTRVPFRTILGDVTDQGKLERIFDEIKPGVIFHAAAYKHVPMLESHPEEAIDVNVQGTMNLCALAAKSDVERFVFISTDKAVHPVNVLGYSKRLGELIARAHQGEGGIFCSVRFGNVVGSRGSALPEFIRQIDAGGPVLVTHPEVERYFMTIPEAVNLVIQAGSMASGGEIFMLDMGEPVKIDDLAKRIIRMRGLRVGTDIEVSYTGLRPGEKLTEELVFHGETTSTTANPAIVSVQDDAESNLKHLESWLRILTHSASHNPSAARALLREAAEAEGAPPTPRRVEAAVGA